MDSKLRVSYSKLEKDAKLAASMLAGSAMKGQAPMFDSVYGIPTGGVLPAFIIAKELSLPLVSRENISSKTLIVDDLIDSGRTIQAMKKDFPDNVYAVLYRKPHSPNDLVYYTAEVMDGWIELPHEAGSNKEIEDSVVRILQYLGEDPTREGLKDTPKRVVKSWKRLFGGYEQKVEDVMTVFEGENYDQMVLLKDIPFYSNCEHHMQPFFGKAHVAYIPNGKIVGISKLARIVEIFSRRLQNQERLTMQVGEALEEFLSPKGVAVVFEGQHFCMQARGVEKGGAIMKTAHLTGVFRDNENNARNEFYNLL